MVYSFLDYGFDIDDHHFKLCEPSGIKPLDYFKRFLKFTVINQKTLKYENDFQAQVMTLHSPISKGQSTCALYMDPFYLISDLTSAL